MTTVLHERPYGKEIKSFLSRKKRHTKNQDSNFLQLVLAIDSVSAPILFRRERLSQHLKRFFFKNRAMHFHFNITTVIGSIKRNKLNFSSIEINKPLPAPVYSASQISFKFRSQPQLLVPIRCLFTLRSYNRIESSIISISSNLTKNTIKKVITLQQEKYMTKCSLDELQH